MKLLECVLDSFIREMVDIDAMQFGFVPGRGTTDAIFIIRQLQEKYIAANKPLALLHGSETWAPTAPDLQRLRRNDRSMVCWICGVRDDDEVSADTLCAILGVQEVTAALRTRRLRWYGHVAGSSSCINSITSMTILSARRRGGPKKTWSERVKTDMKMCSLGSIDPLNREAWGLGFRHSSHLLPTPVPGTLAAVEK